MCRTCIIANIYKHLIYVNLLDKWQRVHDAAIPMIINTAPLQLQLTATSRGNVLYAGTMYCSAHMMEGNAMLSDEFPQLVVDEAAGLG